MWKIINPKISVIIPVKNEASRIAACLEGILSQSVPVFEIIVIDSGSTDGTQAIAANYSKVEVVSIPPADFNHGDTRNMGVELAKGEYVLFTVGDARPVDEYWISQLLSGFKDDSVAGVCGIQVVAHENDTNPIEWFKPINREPKIRSYQCESEEYFESLTAEEKKEYCSWDDVSAMYRRDIKLTIPYKKIVYGEDVYWAMDALKAGYTLVYNPLARVYHFHHESYQTMLKKTIGVCYLRYTALGAVPDRVNVSKQFMRAVYQLLKENRLSYRETLNWIIYNYHLIRALSSGVRYFEKARASEGDQGLDSLHEKYCGTPPIPIKKNE